MPLDSTTNVAQDVIDAMDARTIEIPDGEGGTTTRAPFTTALEKNNTKQFVKEILDAIWAELDDNYGGEIDVAPSGAVGFGGAVNCGAIRNRRDDSVYAQSGDGVEVLEAGLYLVSFQCTVEHTDDCEWYAALALNGTEIADSRVYGLGVLGSLGIGTFETVSSSRFLLDLSTNDVVTLVTALGGGTAPSKVLEDTNLCIETHT